MSKSETTEERVDPVTEVKFFAACVGIISIAVFLSFAYAAVRGTFGMNPVEHFGVVMVGTLLLVPGTIFLGFNTVAQASMEVARQEKRAKQMADKVRTAARAVENVRTMMGVVVLFFTSLLVIDYGTLKVHDDLWIHFTRLDIDSLCMLVSIGMFFFCERQEKARARELSSLIVLLDLTREAEEAARARA